MLKAAVLNRTKGFFNYISRVGYRAKRPEGAEDGQIKNITVLPRVCVCVCACVCVYGRVFVWVSVCDGV